MKVSRSALLPYSATQMYQVVSDISAYPQFLNWCEHAEILQQEDNKVMAKLTISYGKLKMQFSTQNINQQSESIAVTLLEGPFSALSGQWNFKELSSDACKVSLDMDFTLDSSIAKIFSKAFEKIISSQLDAFQKRAQQLYGKPNATN